MSLIISNQDTTGDAIHLLARAARTVKSGRGEHLQNNSVHLEKVLANVVFLKILNSRTAERSIFFAVVILMMK